MSTDGWKLFEEVVKKIALDTDNFRIAPEFTMRQALKAVDDEVFVLSITEGGLLQKAALAVLNDWRQMLEYSLRCDFTQPGFQTMLLDLVEVYGGFHNADGADMAKMVCRMMQESVESGRVHYAEQLGKFQERLTGLQALGEGMILPSEIAGQKAAVTHVEQVLTWTSQIGQIIEHTAQLNADIEAFVEITQGV